MAAALIVFLLVVGTVPVLAGTASAESSTPAGEATEPASVPAPTDAEIEAVEQQQKEHEEWLAGPQAEEERAESQDAYAEVTAGEAEALLVESFPEALASINADPGRVLSRLEVEEVVGAHAAIVGNGEGGERQLVETSVLVESGLGGEGEQPVDLALEPVSEGFIPANPLTELQLPATAEGQVVLEGDVKVELPATDDHESVPLGEANLFIPETEASTDTLLSPVAGGVEVSEQLRSAEAPEEFTFDLALPAGAHVVATDDGGAEIVSASGSVLEEVPAPTAVDAQGSSVPVELGVTDDGISMRVPHEPSDEIAYPILADPTFVTEEGYFPFFGAEPGEGYGLRDLGSSLNAYSEPNRWYGAWTHAAWVYTAPGETSFIAAGYFSPVDFLAGSCNTAEPHGYVGLYNVQSGAYQGWGTFSGGSSQSTYETGWVGGPGTRYAMIGIGTDGQKVEAISCYHEIYVGGYLIQLMDAAQPVLSAQGSDQWIDASPIRLAVAASDSGLGVKRFRTEAIDTPGNPTWETTNSCVGTRASMCPGVWNLAEGSQPILSFNPAVMREGIDQLRITAYDPVDEPSTNSDTITVRVDHAPPRLTVSGTVFEQASLGTELPYYTIRAAAEDGVPNSGNPADVRAGVKNLKFFEDGTEIEPGRAQPECAGTQSCKAAREYKIPTLSRSVGVHHIRITTEDALGHVAAPRELTYTITRDTTPPEISVNGMPEEGATVGSHPPQYWAKAVDDGRGVTKLVFKVDNEVIEEATQECSNGGCSLNGSVAPDLTEISPGEHVLSVVATDAAGNQSEVSRHVRVETALPELRLGGRIVEREGEPLGAEHGDLRIQAQSAGFSPAAEGLVAAYSFDENEGKVAYDSASGHDGEIKGAKWTGNGKYGGALEFNASEHDELTIPDTENLRLRQFTLEAWVEPEASGEEAPIIAKTDPEGFGYALFAGVEGASGHPQGFNTYKEWVYGYVYGDAELPLHRWTHLAVTSNGEELRLYVNGRLVDEREAEDVEAGEGLLQIGGDEPFARGGYFDGRIDEVRVYNRALSQGEVEADESTAIQTPPSKAPVAAYSFNQNEGKVAYDSDGGHDGEIKGANWTSSGKYGGALEFDASEHDELTIPDSEDLRFRHFTLEAWVDPYESLEEAPIVDKDDPEGFGYALYAGVEGAPGHPQGYITNREWVDSYAYDPAELPVNSWSHVAVTSDGKQLRLYVDGELVDEREGDDVEADGGPLQIGGDERWGAYFDGKIDEVRVYNRTLSEGEVEADKNRPVSASEGMEETEAVISSVNVELEEEEVSGYPKSCSTDCREFTTDYEYDASAAGPGPHRLTVEVANSLGDTVSRNISVDTPEEDAGTPACSAEIEDEVATDTVSPQEAVETVEEAMPAALAPSDPGEDETGEGQLDPTFSTPEPNLVAEGTPAKSETSVSPTGGVSLARVACITLGSTTTSATAARVVNSDAAVFANTGAESDTVVRPTASGVMIDESIRGPESDAFVLNVKVHEGDELVQLPSGAIAVVEPETGGGGDEATGEIDVDQSEAPEGIGEPSSLADAQSQREEGEYELALAASEISGTVVAVIAEPWILLANEEIIPAHIEIAPVIEEPNEYIVNYRLDLPAGEQAAAVYPVQATAIASVLTAEGGCMLRRSPCNEPDLTSASQYAEFWANPNRVVRPFEAYTVYSRNPFYEDFGANNCTNFISQILRAGGEKWMRWDHSGSEAWWYKRQVPWEPHNELDWYSAAFHSRNWPLADELPRFLWQYGYVHIDPVDEPWGWTRGDILAENWFSDGKGEFNHLQYVVGTTFGEKDIREPLIANSSEPKDSNYGALRWSVVKERIQGSEPDGWTRVPLAWKHTEANANEKLHDPANLYGLNGVFHE